MVRKASPNLKLHLCSIYRKSFLVHLHKSARASAEGAYAALCGSVVRGDACDAAWKVIYSVMRLILAEGGKGKGI